jgi:hypothetical protein
MSAIFPLPHSPRTFGPYTATAGQTDFAASFGIQDDDDVEVTRTRGGAASILVLDVDYEVISANDPNGFTVRLLAGALAGDIISGRGLAVIERTSSIVQAGQFNSRIMDRELDRSRIIDMELRRDVDDLVQMDIQNAVTQVANDRAAAEVAAADAELSAAQADTSADLAQTERIAAQGAAAAAANFAGVSYGVNLGSPVLHATNFTVSALDYGLLHILTPSLGQTLEVTLPPAASNVGKVIAFSVPHDVSGLVQFKATAGQVSSLISDYATDDFFIWQKETVTLLARSDRWLILDWRKNPFFLQADLPATDIDLTAGASNLLNGWVGANYAGTYLRHSVFGLSGGNIVLPRRGGYLLEVDLFCNWTGTPPTYLYVDIDTVTGGIPGRGYADFIQASSPTQANINFRKSLNASRTVIVNPRVYCGTGSTTPRILASAAQPRLRLTEMF